MKIELLCTDIDNDIDIDQACQQYISIAIYLFIAINIFIIALFSILQYIIAAKKLQYYCNILQKYVSVRVYIEI